VRRLTEIQYRYTRGADRKTDLRAMVLASEDNLPEEHFELWLKVAQCIPIFRKVEKKTIDAVSQVVREFRRAVKPVPTQSQQAHRRQQDWR
jgi:hypothetical protein